MVCILELIYQFAQEHNGKADKCMMNSIQLRKDYLQQKILIQRLQERIKELEALTSHCNQAECEEFQLEYQKQSEESIVVLKSGVH